MSKVVLVTGASRGIGLATALHLAGLGHEVVGYARDAGPLRREAERRGAGNLSGVDGDVADEAQVARLFEGIDRRHGRIDAVVNNAGVFERAPIGEMSMAAFDRVMAVNVRGVYLCSREAFRRMARQPDGGDIVNISSLSGVKGVEKFTGTSAYVASKYAVAGLSEQLASEGKSSNIRVKAISPGAVDTEQLASSSLPIKAGISAEQLARIIAFFLSEEGRPLSGSNLEIFSNA